MDTDDGWPRVWAEMSDEERRDRGSGIIYFSRQTVRLNMQNASRNSWPKPTSVERLKWRMTRGSGSGVTNRRNKSSLDRRGRRHIRLPLPNRIVPPRTVTKLLVTDADYA